MFGAMAGYEASEPKREEVDRWKGPAVLEFGNDWCGHCMRAQALIETARKGHEGVRHLKIADASGKRLGRTYRVKLWPTLIFLDNGVEVARLVRPHDPREIAQAFAKIDPGW